MAGAAGKAAARRVAVADGEIAVEVSGEAGSGAVPLVLLHGWAMDRRLWADQIPTHAAERLVIAPDRRGYGASSAPPALAREADDVAAILDDVGAARAVILGMSQSGRVAADFALRHPARAAGVIFQGARLGSLAANAAPDIPLAEYAALARAGRLAELKARWRGHPLMRLAAPDRQPLIDEMLDAYSGADLLAAAPPGREPDDAALAASAAPALFVTGAEDTALRRRIAAHLATILPDAEHVEVAGAGHLCNICARAAFNAAVARFLARVDARLRARTSATR